MTGQRLTAAIALVAAAGITVRIVGGADYPLVPPELLIVLTAAAICLRWRRWGALPAGAGAGRRDGIPRELTTVVVQKSAGGIAARRFIGGAK